MSILQAALDYAARGWSVLPVAGKKPSIGEWRQFQQRRAAPADIYRWARAGQLTGVAVVCGRISGLVVVDLDGDEACDVFARAWPQLLDTYTVQTGSGHGLHLYLTGATTPPTTRAPGYELRADGCYVVAPPSPGVGRPYTVLHQAPLLDVPDFAPLIDWIRSKQSKPPTPAPAAGGQAARRSNPSAWARAALEGECASVKRAGDGTRNNALYRAALKMGSLIAAGALDEFTVTNELFAAATMYRAGDGDKQALRTIRSGLDTGKKSPRQLRTQ